MLLNRPIQTRFRYGSTFNGLTLQHTVSHWPIMRKVRGRTWYIKRKILKYIKRSPTACRQTVSGTISLPLPGYFSPFPHGTSSLSVAGVYLALGDGPPGFPQGSTCPAVLGNSIKQAYWISYTGLSPSMVYLSRYFYYPISFWLAERPANLSDKAPQHQIYNACRLEHTSGLGCSRFARRY